MGRTRGGPARKVHRRDGIRAMRVGLARAGRHGRGVSSAQSAGKTPRLSFAPRRARGRTVRSQRSRSPQRLRSETLSSCSPSGATCADVFGPAGRNDNFPTISNFLSGRGPSRERRIVRAGVGGRCRGPIRHRATRPRWTGRPAVGSPGVRGWPRPVDADNGPPPRPPSARRIYGSAGSGPEPRGVVAAGTAAVACVVRHIVRVCGRPTDSDGAPVPVGICLPCRCWTTGAGSEVPGGSDRDAAGLRAGGCVRLDSPIAACGIGGRAGAARRHAPHAMGPSPVRCAVGRSRSHPHAVHPALA